MQLILTIPIYRNKFQKPTLFFSKQKFPIGSIVFISFPFKPSSKNKKPAIVISVNSLKNKKTFIRRNKIEINKITNETVLLLFKEEIIKITKLAEEKNDYSINEIFQKIFAKKTIQELNKLKPNSDIKNIKKITDKLTIDLIKKKIRKTKPIQKKTIENKKGIKSIASVLQEKTATKTTLHTEKHYLVNEIRNYFGETAKKGKGSFGFYLGFFNRVPLNIIYQYWAEVKESRKPIKNQQKIFWWKIGQYLKNKN